MPRSSSTPAAVSKAKPKIRIIHVCAPEIITTDVANFRELVQTLTGKPPQETRKWSPEEGLKPEKKGIQVVS
ncbi:hypothetical protein V6N13_007721 [Hibiscus sabdariffa]